MNKDNCVSACRSYEAEGQRGEGRGKKSWMDCVENDLREWNLDSGLVGNRLGWRNSINDRGRARRRRDERCVE